MATPNVLLAVGYTLPVGMQRQLRDEAIAGMSASKTDNVEDLGFGAYRLPKTATLEVKTMKSGRPVIVISPPDDKSVDATPLSDTLIDGRRSASLCSHR